MLDGRPMAAVSDLARGETMGRRRSRFVGRALQLAQLERAFDAALDARQLVTIVGATGMGKSMLARRFADDVRRHGSRVCWLSGDEITINARDILAALNAQGMASFADLGRDNDGPDLLVVDAFERFLPLASWFFEQLSLAGSRLCVVLTTRERIDPRKLQSAGRRLDTSEVLMDPLSPWEATTVLREARVPEVLQRAISTAAQGHPLTLALFAERYAESRATWVDPADATDAVVSLSRKLLREAKPAHRDALHALALGTPLDVDLLYAVTGDKDAVATFDWLMQRSFTRLVPGGITLHTLVRDALFADLVAQPTRWAVLAERMIDELEKRFAHTRLERKLQLLLEMLAVRTPFVRDALGIETMSRRHLRQGRDEDAEIVTDWIESFEGAAAAAIFRHWYALQPEGFFVLADEELTPAGVYFVLRVGDTTAEQRACDPIAAHAWDVLRGLRARSGRQDEEMVCARWFFARDTYQSFGPELTAVMFCGPILLAAHPRPVRYVARYVTDAERWKPYDRASWLEPIDETVRLGDDVYSPHVRTFDQARAIRGLLSSAGVVHEPKQARSTVRSARDTRPDGLASGQR